MQMHLPTHPLDLMREPVYNLRATDAGKSGKTGVKVGYKTPRTKRANTYSLKGARNESEGTAIQKRRIRHLCRRRAAVSSLIDRALLPIYWLIKKCAEPMI